MNQKKQLEALRKMPKFDWRKIAHAMNAYNAAEKADEVAEMMGMDEKEARRAREEVFARIEVPSPESEDGKAYQYLSEIVGNLCEASACGQALFQRAYDRQARRHVWLFGVITGGPLEKPVIKWLGTFADKEGDYDIGGPRMGTLDELSAEISGLMGGK